MPWTGWWAKSADVPAAEMVAKPIDDVVAQSQKGAKSSVYRFQDPWFATAWDNLRLFAVQLACAGGSGAAAKTAVAPLERVKVLLQVQRMSNVPPAQQYTGLLDALKRIPAQEGGFLALYRGNGANVARLVPEVAFKFVVHDQFKIMFAPPDGTPLGMSEKLAAGAATGVLKTVMFYPLDLCRTRITADQTPAGLPRPYGTMRGVLRSTLSREGATGLYKGLAASMLGVVPYLSLSFTAYDELKAILPDDKQTRSQWWFPFAKMGCGAAAAALAQTVTYPLDTIRRRRQLDGALGQATAYRGYLGCIASMARREGLAGFYRGALVNCLKTVPGAAVQFVAYDTFKLGVAWVDPTSGVSSPL